jgi:hypothetical protein
MTAGATIEVVNRPITVEITSNNVIQITRADRVIEITATVGSPTIQLKATSIGSVSTGEKFYLTTMARQTTLSRIDTLLQGTSPDVTWELRQDLDISNVGTVIHTASTTNDTTGEIITTITAPIIPANAHIWVEFTAVSGTVDAFNIGVAP